MPHADSNKVFCISMQRTGTTSVGKFFIDFGFKRAAWPADDKNDWSTSWYEGDYEKIFCSIDFRKTNAYEDSPWWLPGFFKILFHRFPNSKFVLFTRDPDEWFQSMLKHSHGNIIGRSRIHCKICGRELEYFNLMDSDALDEGIENELFSEKTLKFENYSEHYKKIYRVHNLDVQDFFRRHAPKSLHVGKLEDPDKWQKLGEFLGIDVPIGYRSHQNASRR